MTDRSDNPEPALDATGRALEVGDWVKVALSRTTLEGHVVAIESGGMVRVESQTHWDGRISWSVSAKACRWTARPADVPAWSGPEPALDAAGDALQPGSFVYVADFDDHLLNGCLAVVLEQSGKRRLTKVEIRLPRGLNNRSEWVLTHSLLALQFALRKGGNAPETAPESPNRNSSASLNRPG